MLMQERGSGVVVVPEGGRENLNVPEGLMLFAPLLSHFWPNVK